MSPAFSSHIIDDDPDHVGQRHRDGQVVTGVLIAADLQQRTVFVDVVPIT